MKLPDAIVKIIEKVMDKSLQKRVENYVWRMQWLKLEPVDSCERPLLEYV